MTPPKTHPNAKPHAWLAPAAIVSGLLGLVLFVLTPFMPINQVQSSLQWPQQHSLRSVNAPLESYTPMDFEADVPLESTKHLHEGQSLILSTLPQDSNHAISRGLLVRYKGGDLDVIVRDQVLMELTAEDLDKLPDNASVHITSTLEATTASVTPPDDLEDSEATLTGDFRPITTGIYSELRENATSLEDAGLHVGMEINSRFTSTPSVWKYLTMWLGGLSLLVSLVCLGMLDRRDGQPSHRVLHRNALRPRLLDAIVVGVLGLWYLIGANTSDDGYILTMARSAQDSGYMANYYRWFGVPESPFGAPYYDLLSWMTNVSTASIWMRLPSLVSGIVIWFALSREVLPRLGGGVNGRRVAHWTAAFVLLAFWLPFNNGLRPEPIIAAGALLTWLSFEAAIASKRLLPAAIGTMLAAFTLACGPTGLMAVTALLASISPLIKITYQRIGLVASRTWVAVLAMIAPIGAAGTAVLVAVFGDQPLSNVMESIDVRAAKGPSLKWFHEYTRYDTLMQQTVDGSFARRVPVFIAFAALAVVIAVILRNRRIPGSVPGPAQRLMLVMVGTLFFMMFTPTKWTHHFGVWAGIAAALGALAAVGLSHLALRSARVRTLSIGAFLFVLAFALSGTNGWWYISSYGVPWFDKSIQIHGIEASNVMLSISLLVLALGAIQGFVLDVQATKAEEAGENPDEVRRGGFHQLNGLASAPIALVCAAAVLFSMGSLAKGFASQYPAYSVGLGNLRSLKGTTCALAEDVLLETNTNDAFLKPVHSRLGTSLEEGETNGFQATRVPAVIVSDDEVNPATSNSNTVDDESSTEDVTFNSGVRRNQGVNGARIQLPFGLDSSKVPVLGSYTPNGQVYADATTDWYELPQATEQAPLLVVTAAGRIAHVDINGIQQYGQELVVQYGKRGENGKVEQLGEVMMDDAGPSTVWRNLRLPLDRIPPEADVIRLHASDKSLDPKQWMAFTPPRVPDLDTLNNVVGSEVPVLLDWSVPLQFPCQRPYAHYAGVAEMPEYRISPDYGGRITGTPFQDALGGGVMGPAESVNTSYQLPSYAKSDWRRDWGSIERYRPRTNADGEEPAQAEITMETITRPPMWNPGPMNIAVLE